MTPVRMFAFCIYLITAITLASWVSTSVLAQARQSDRDIAQAIVKECRAIYHTDGKPCACPDDLGRDRTPCGNLSAYSQSAGAAPKCYVTDVTAQEIADYKNNNKQFLIRCVSR